MTLKEVISRIEAVASAQPAIHTIARGNVYKLNEAPDIEWGAFAWTQEEHSASVDTPLIDYRFDLFYADRLTEDEGNMIEVQSTGVEVLDNIIRTLADELGVSAWTIRTFRERFADVCAGAYATVTVSAPFEYGCGDGFEGKIVKII